MTVGASLSFTVTVAVQVLVFPWPSSPVRVTVLVPKLLQVKVLGKTDT